jgi:uncharacterized membrane protein YdbT with pleckstrin-like domain
MMASSDWKELPFNLQKGERVLEEVEPKKNGFVLARILSGILPCAGISAIAGIYIILGASKANLGIGLGIAATVALFFVIVLLNAGLAFVAYGKFRYWVTNYRVVGRRGIIGYSVDSIPLENITDIIIGRGVAERILGLSSLRIIPIGGTSMATYGRYGGINSANYFPALLPKHAKELQERIFDLRNKRKRETGRVL